MRKFVNKLAEERGLTLIELIATMALLAVLSGIVYTVILFGISSYEKIQIENSLRDEADLLMSTIMAELYTNAPDKIEEGSGGIKLIGGKLSAPLDISIYDESLHIGARTIDIQAQVNDSSEIKLQCPGGSSSSGSLICGSGLIEILLVIERTYGDKTMELTLASKFGY